VGGVEPTPSVRHWFTYNVTFWRFHVASVATVRQQCVLLFIELYIRARGLTTKSVCINMFYDKFVSPATIERA